MNTKKVLLFFTAIFSTTILICTSSFAAVTAQVAESAPQNFAAQLSLAKDKSQPMGTRWSALLKASDLADAQQIEEIKQFTKNDEWYMRNAAMMALTKISSDYGVEAARKLVKDKALVVRSAAVDVIATKFTLENRAILAEELVQKYNFKGKQSLWIRPQIMRHLSARATVDDRSFFARHLFDKDEAIGLIAAQTLEKISDISFTGDKKLSNWKSLVKDKGWL